jgi:hypothetical protein
MSFLYCNSPTVFHLIIADYYGRDLRNATLATVLPLLPPYVKVGCCIRELQGGQIVPRS